MATQQDEGGVPLSIAHEMQQFRLFELPSDIVALIDAPHPPRLSIKSRAPSSTPNDKPAYAVLCTPDKTFELRQVQTSNLLFITQPALETHGNEIPISVTRAIASCTQTLELHPYTPSAATLLREILPIYELIDGEIDAISNQQSKTAIFEDLPLSDGQCQTGWDELIAFEHENSSYQPSANALSQVWSSINAAALAEAVKLDNQFLTDEITRAVTEEGYAPNFVEALLRYLSKDGQDTNGPWSCLDRVKTVTFIGKILLEAKHGNDFLIAEFTDTWEDKLPEAWCKDAQLSAIEGAYEFPTETTIRTKKTGTTTTIVGGPAATAKSSAGKWHEKFGKTRKK
ncbi:sister chromatid cohesion protein Dcc1 [Phaeosphaeriaceae sp. PMI808]|nr:sister chromatid cohesion protein Dcc1 [Phaeosphaeriaceae sp. PMI808]